MCCSNFGALIQSDTDHSIKSDARSFILDAWLYHQAMFDRVINPNPTKRSKKDRILEYAMIQVKSDLYTDDERTIFLCKELHLLYVDDNKQSDLSDDFILQGQTSMPTHL
jgi:hypothetical protein